METLDNFNQLFGHDLRRRVDAMGKPISDQKDKILMIDEDGAYLKAGKRTVYRLATSGKLPASKLGGTWRFRRDELDDDGRAE